MAFLSTTHTTLRCRSLARSRHPRGHAALHRPAPSQGLAGHGLRGLSLSGSGRLGVPVPTPLYTARLPLGPGPVTGYAASPCPARADSEYRYPRGSCRLGIRPRLHPCSALADSDYRRIVGSGRLGFQRPVTSHDVDYSSSHRCETFTSACGCLPQQVPLPMVEKSGAADLKSRPSEDMTLLPGTVEFVSSST